MASTETPSSNFKIVGYVPKGLSIDPKRREAEMSTKGIVLDQLDNPAYSEEYRQKIRDIVDYSHFDPELFDKNPGVLHNIYDPYATVERDGFTVYPTSADSEGFVPFKNPYVDDAASDVINLNKQHVQEPYRFGTDVFAHEGAHTNKDMTAKSIIDAFGGYDNWKRFIKNIESNSEVERGDSQRISYLESIANDAPAGRPAEDYRSYIGDLASGLSDGQDVDPREFFADFEAIRQRFLAEKNIDITRDPLFIKKVFSGSKTAEAAFRKIMQKYDK